LNRIVCSRWTASHSAATITPFQTLLLFLFRELLLGRGLARRVRRLSWIVHQSKSRAIGWINAIGRTCPGPNSVAPRVVFHSPAGPVFLLPSEIRAPHFYCINHARRTYPAKYSLFEPKTRILDCPPTWSQNALCTISIAEWTLEVDAWAPRLPECSGSSYSSGIDGTVPVLKFLAMRPMTVTYQSDGNVHPSSSR
jgi:hypothetical protein